MSSAIRLGSRCWRARSQTAGATIPSAKSDVLQRLVWSGTPVKRPSLEDPKAKGDVEHALRELWSSRLSGALRSLAGR
jgi:hypothetical protein